MDDYLKDMITFIENAVFKCCNVQREKVLTKSRDASKVTYRHAIYYLVKKYTGISNEAIGRHYGFDTSNISTAINSIKFRLAEHRSYVVENIRTADNFIYKRFNFDSFMSEFTKEVTDVNNEGDFKNLINKYKKILNYEF